MYIYVCIYIYIYPPRSLSVKFFCLRCRQLCQDQECPGFRSKNHVRKLYLTPLEVARLVPLQPLPEAPEIKT